jgi:hypothetical protein
MTITHTFFALALATLFSYLLLQRYGASITDFASKINYRWGATSEILREQLELLLIFGAIICVLYALGHAQIDEPSHLRQGGFSLLYSAKYTTCLWVALLLNFVHQNMSYSWKSLRAKIYLGIVLFVAWLQISSLVMS